MSSVVYSREKHAAHAGDSALDLESWDVVQAYGDTRPAEVPANATRDYGYVDQRGAQHFVYRRQAPASAHPGCRLCGSTRRGTKPASLPQLMSAAARSLKEHA